MRRLLVILCMVLVASAARAEVRTCRVRYLSADHVYLDAGSTAGLDEGMRVRVVRDGQDVAELEVVYTADHSASCRVVGGSGAPAVGDEVRYEVEETTPAPADTTVTPGRVRTTAAASPGPGGGGAPLELRGWAALQWDGARESADRSLGTDVLRLPFRLSAGRVGGDLELRARGTLRRIWRHGFTGSTPTREWRNRILEAGLVREGRDLTWEFALGRVGSRATAGAGPVDGLALRRRLGGGLRVGAFGGFAPRWGDLSFRSEDRAFGALLHWTSRAEGGQATDLRLAAVGRYREGEISREYLTMTTTWRNERLSLLQAAEVDVYRGWRKDAGGGALRLTSGALGARYRFSPAWSAHLGYDDREPVRTWENRSLPDSLFTDAGRKGVRGGVGWRAPRDVRVDASAGVRREDAGDRTTSWNVAVRLPSSLVGWVDVTASVRGFQGPWLKGTSPSLRVRRVTRTGWRLSAEGGHFAYTSERSGNTRRNTWLEAGAGRDLGGSWEAFGSWRQDWGDDIVGGRWFLELARRF